MITGEDTVLVAHGPVRPVVERFLDRWSQRWPQLRIASDNEGSGAFAQWVPEPGSRTGTGTGTGDRGAAWGESADQLLVARDEGMLTHWDEYGYVLDARQEGPFAVMYRPAGWRSLKATALEDPYGHSGFGYEPYEVTLVGAQLWMITVVTPDDEVFRSSVVDTLTASFTT